jgi:hypothetical protein
MRDALIDTILEKQSETNNAMRNVRDNLEVMARAGEAPVTAASVGQLTAPGARPSAGMQSGASSKSGFSGGQSMKANPPVSISVPGQAQGQAQAQMQMQTSSAAPAAPAMASSPIQMPSAQSVKASAASRKHSGSAAAPASVARSSVSVEMSESYAPDDFGTGFNSNVSLASGSQSMDMGSLQRSAVAAYQRPSMAGQEIRGGAPPTVMRQTSVVGGPAGANPNAALARQLSSKLSVSESAPTLGTQVPQPRLSTPPPAQHAYQNFDLDASPEPDQFSRTFAPASSGVHQSPRTSASTAAPRSVPQAASQPQMQMYQPQAVYPTPMPAPVTFAQPAPVQQRAAPAAAHSHQGQVRYAPPPQMDTTPKYQLHPAYQQQAGVMDNVETTDALYVPPEYQHFQQAQFLADLCLNFEEISVKRKRVANVPTVMCESIADITQDIAEFMAKAADFEMVQYMLSSVAGLTSAQDISYDENLVLTKRNHKIEEYLASMTNLIILTSRNQQPGIVRMDARSLFVSLVKKGLDMFMSKHNQVRNLCVFTLSSLLCGCCCACLSCPCGLINMFDSGYRCWWSATHGWAASRFPLAWLATDRSLTR